MRPIRLTWQSSMARAQAWVMSGVMGMKHLGPVPVAVASSASKCCICSDHPPGSPAWQRLGEKTEASWLPRRVRLQMLASHIRMVLDE